MKPAPDRRLSSLKLKHGLWVTFPLCRFEGLLSPRRLFFSSFAASAFSAEPQNLPPQGRRSIWREHGVMRARILLSFVQMQRRMMCSDCGVVGRCGLRTTEINVLRVVHLRALPHCASRCSGKFVMKSFYIDLLLSQPAQPIIWEWPVC